LDVATEHERGERDREHHLDDDDHQDDRDGRHHLAGAPFLGHPSPSAATYAGLREPYALQPGSARGTSEPSTGRARSIEGRDEPRTGLVRTTGIGALIRTHLSEGVAYGHIP